MRHCGWRESGFDPVPTRDGKLGVGTAIKVIDATLREGAQAPGVRWTVEQSAEIARALDSIGVDAIECGHAAIGSAEQARIIAVRQSGIRAPLLVHARALRADVDAAADCGADWVGIFLGVNDVARRARVRRTVPTLHGLLDDAIGHARRRGLSVRYTLEDATRTDEAEMIAAYRTAAKAGANRLGLADTVGCAEPTEILDRVVRVRDALPEIPVEVHLHDDRGLALANALAAVDAGAEWVSTSVLGLGERCGVPDLAATLANLAARAMRPWPPADSVRRLSARVAEITGCPPDVRRPVIGAFAFTHSAKLHVRAMGRDPSAYAWVEAERVGRRVVLSSDSDEPEIVTEAERASGVDASDDREGREQASPALPVAHDGKPC